MESSTERSNIESRSQDVATRDRRSPSDDCLLSRLARGDDAAFVALVEKWRPDFVRFFRLLGARAGDAEDLAQEVFLRLLRFRDRYRSRGVGRARAFLLRVARNVFVDSLRRRSRRIDPVALDSVRGDLTPVTELVDASTRISDRLDLEAALSRLPDRLRWVLVLNVYEGLEYREVASVLGIPVGTVKSRMHHALIALREALGDA